MPCATSGTTRDFPVATNRRQPNCVAPICPARLGSGQKILFCLCSELSPCSHFVTSSFVRRVLTPSEHYVMPSVALACHCALDAHTHISSCILVIIEPSSILYTFHSFMC